MDKYDSSKSNDILGDEAYQQFNDTYKYLHIFNRKKEIQNDKPVFPVRNMLKI